MQQYWDRHPFQYELVSILREGQWVSHVFELLFMYVSLFSGYLMTLAVGYLIFYAIEFKHSLDAVAVHPTFPDQVAIASNVIINVGPELVFPGIVVLCIRSFTTRRWVDGTLYAVTTIAFGLLTMSLLNAFMNDGITKDFLAAMLFWRALAALFYTVVVAYCGGHGGLDFRSLLNELDILRVQVNGGQQQTSSLQGQLEGVQQHASTLQHQVEHGQHTISILREQLEAEQQRVVELQADLEKGQGVIVLVRGELSAALVDVETMRTQLNGKKQELANLREMQESGQEWQESRAQQVLNAEVKRATQLQELLNEEQGISAGLRRQVSTALGEVETMQRQVNAKQREVEDMVAALANEQQQVSTLRKDIVAQQQQMSTLHKRILDSGQPAQVSTKQGKVDGSGQQTQVDTEQHRVIHLMDAPRARSSDGREAARQTRIEHIKRLLESEPGISDRAIAMRLGCSPTTVGNDRETIEQELASCVNK